MKDFGKYERQIALDGFGLCGQRKLCQSKIVVVGAGGVGAAVIPLLAGAGIGTLTVVDGDVVSEHNLHRQTLYRASDVGRGKAELAADFVRARNPDISAEFIAERLSAQNATKILKDCRLCIDATDSFASRAAVSMACAACGIPEISASAEGFVCQNIFFGDGFRLSDLVDDDTLRTEAEGRAIFPPAAHMSGVWAAAAAFAFIVFGKLEVGDFQMFDFSSQKYFSANLR